MSEKMGFWDASAIIALCVEQFQSQSAAQLLQEYSIQVWWGTMVEAQSALARATREGLSVAELRTGESTLQSLREGWVEVLPTPIVRELAETLPKQYGLRAGDAFQLAAALVWCERDPSGQPFICFDDRLREAAVAAGFTVEPLVNPKPPKSGRS